MNAYLPFCRYYHGELEAPVDKDYETFTQFWYLERNYLGIYNDEHEYWEGEGLNEYFKDDDRFNEFTKSFPLQVKGFLACSAIYSYSHNPAGGIDFIYNYGKNIEYPI